MLYAEKIFAEALDSVLATLETFNFRNVSEFSFATTVLVILDVFVWVNYLYHFLFLLILKLVIARWVERKWITFCRQLKCLIEISLLVVPIHTQQVHYVDRLGQDSSSCERHWLLRL